MTLKHSSRAKWAKKQHTREHRDPAVSPIQTYSMCVLYVRRLCRLLCPSTSLHFFWQTQQALSEHHNKKIQLKQKIVEEEEEETDSDG